MDTNIHIQMIGDIFIMSQNGNYNIVSQIITVQLNLRAREDRLQLGASGLLLHRWNNMILLYVSVLFLLTLLNPSLD